MRHFLTAGAIIIALSDDSLVEGNETFSVALASPTGGATLGSPSSETVTIADNDVPPPPPSARSSSTRRRPRSTRRRGPSSLPSRVPAAPPGP